MDPYDFILQKVAEAGELVMRLKGEVFATHSKGGDPRDIVTSVDMSVSKFLIEEIRNMFPGDSIYSEEGGGVEHEGGRLWVIDPIDGTANFSRNIPHFSVCVGFLEGGVPSAGGVYNPATKELFSFKKGAGAFLNGERIHTSPIADLSQAHVFFHAGRKKELWDWGGESYRKLLANANKTKNFSGFALDTCFVAAGRIEANIYGALTQTLDLAPALGILAEAGGVASDERGGQVVFPSSVQKLYMANNGTMLESVRSLLES